MITITDENVAKLMAELAEVKAALGAGGVGASGGAMTGHGRKTEKITGFVFASRTDGKPKVDLYGREDLEFKVVTMWEEQIDEIGLALIKPHLAKAQRSPVGALKRKQAETSNLFYTLPQPIYAVVEVREVDDGKGGTVKKSKLISLHDAPVTADAEQRPVHHHTLDTVVTARQKHKVQGDTLAMCLYAELSDLFASPASIEETIRLITGRHISLDDMPEIAAMLTHLAWSRYLNQDLDRDGLLSIGQSVWQAMSALRNPAPTPVPDIKVLEVQGLPETRPAAATHPNQSQAGDDPLWKSAVEAFDKAGAAKFGLRWGENRAAAISWAYHNLTTDKNLSRGDAGKIKLEQVTYSQLVKAANALNSSPFA